MAKKRRKKRQSKGREINPFILPILAVVASVVIGIAYWKAPEDTKQKIRDSFSNAVETVKGKLEDRLAELSNEQTELATDENVESASGDRPLSYAGLPEATSYPYPITVLTNQGYISGYCEERKNPAWVSYRVFKLADAESPPRPSRFTVDTRNSSRVRHDDDTRSE